MTDLALYATVWSALVLFVAGEAGKVLRYSAAVRRGWPWLAWTAGATLLAAHIVIAFQMRHGWDHASAARAVAAQSRAMYGIGWTGGIWMNYLFLAVWMAEVCWWAAAPPRFLARPRVVDVVVRAFYALILVNAAVVFASPSRRWAGVVLVGAVFWFWRRTLIGRSRAVRHVPASARL